MAKGNNIHDEIKEQRKKLKDLSFSDKIKYIWSYYWIPIVGVILAVIFAVSLISSIVKNLLLISISGFRLFRYNYLLKIKF